MSILSCAARLGFVVLFVVFGFVHPANAAEHVILCPAELAPEFEVLAAHRTQAEVPSVVVTLEEVLATGRPGRDDPETIRNWIVDTFAEGELRYVLLGGDLTWIPSRAILNTFYPSGQGTWLDVDLYYAGLDGDWDADGDGQFGEPFTGSLPELRGDDADLDPDIALGRAPVANAAQARRFVEGVIAYDNAADADHFARALMLAEVLFPVDWTPETPIQLDGAFFADRVADRLLLHPWPIMSSRRYEIRDQVPLPGVLSRATVLADLDAGDFGFVFSATLGTEDAFGAGGDDRVTRDDVLALQNAPDFAVHLSLASSLASLSTPGVGAGLVTAPGGGASAFFGYSAPAFTSVTSRDAEDLTSYLVAQSAVPVGEAWKAVQTDRAPLSTFNSANRWTSMTLLLFGDPAMPFRAESQPVSVDDSSPEDVVVAPFGLEVGPNPLREGSSIRFATGRAADVRVRVYDARGRTVATLFDGRVDGEPRSIQWSGEDLPRGTYFVRAEVDGRVWSEKVSVVR